MFRWLLDIFFPRTCACCSRVLTGTENQLCLQCLMDIPRTNMHRMADNQIEQLYWGKVEIQHASAYFYYEQGSNYRKAIHRMKYGNRPLVGNVFGHVAAAELTSDGALHDVDLLLPVPLHRRRQRQRGYNQSWHIAEGMAEVMHLPVDTTSVERRIANESQTTKHYYERYHNVQGIFSVLHPEALNGCHVLIVDDVITTGSTTESLARTILQHTHHTRVSVFALAVAHS